jgi:uncharacterized membrane protein required for colicin V production
MSKFDLAFLVVIGLSAIMGLVRGITKEILSLVSWVGAVVMSYILFPLTQHIARTHITNPMLADGVTILAIFLIFLIVLTLVSHFFSSMIRQSALSGVDRSLGFGYGILRAFIVLFIFELVISCLWLRAEHPDMIKEARFANFMYKGSDILYTVLPSNAREWIKSLQEKRLNERKAPPSLDNIKQASEVAKQIAPVVQAAIDKANEKIPTAEELANLKPKEQAGGKQEKKANTVKQDIEMDRLIDIANAE